MQVGRAGGEVCLGGDLVGCVGGRVGSRRKPWRIGAVCSDFRLTMTNGESASLA